MEIKIYISIAQLLILILILISLIVIIITLWNIDTKLRYIGSDTNDILNKEVVLDFNK